MEEDNHTLVEPPDYVAHLIHKVVIHKMMHGLGIGVITIRWGVHRQCKKH